MAPLIVQFLIYFQTGWQQPLHEPLRALYCCPGPLGSPQSPHHLATEGLEPDLTGHSQASLTQTEDSGNFSWLLGPILAFTLKWHRTNLAMG